MDYFKNVGDITKSNIMKYITSTHLTLYKLDQITQEGDLDELIDGLITDEEVKKLANSDI